MKRFIAIALSSLLLFSVAVTPAVAQASAAARASLFFKRHAVVVGGGGASVAVNSFTYSLDATFNAGATTMGMGTLYASASCPTFTAGQVIFLIGEADSGGGGDPGALSTPTGGFTSLDDGSHGTFVAGDLRVGMFYKVAAGGETCPFTTNWTNSSSNFAWIAVVLAYTGTPPGSVLDAWHCEAHATEPDANMPAAAITTTNTNDLLFGSYNTRNGFGPYTLNAALSLMVNTEGANAFRSMSMLGQQTLTASGSTGAKNSAMTNTFKNEVNCLIAFNP